MDLLLYCATNSLTPNTINHDTETIHNGFQPRNV